MKQRKKPSARGKAKSHEQPAADTAPQPTPEESRAAPPTPTSGTLPSHINLDDLPVHEPGLSIAPEEMGAQALRDATQQDNFESLVPMQPEDAEADADLDPLVPEPDWEADAEEEGTENEPDSEALDEDEPDSEALDEDEKSRYLEERRERELRTQQRLDREVDEAGWESFPASDPPATNAGNIGGRR